MILKKTTVTFTERTLEQLNELGKLKQYKRSTLIALAVDEFFKKTIFEEVKDDNE